MQNYMGKLVLKNSSKRCATMMSQCFIYELPDVKALFEKISFEKEFQENKTIPPEIIEKDYWLMHCL
jgi:hypothetical protein